MYVSYCYQSSDDHCVEFLHICDDDLIHSLLARFLPFGTSVFVNSGLSYDAPSLLYIVDTEHKVALSVYYRDIPE